MQLTQMRLQSYGSESSTKSVLQRKSGSLVYSRLILLSLVLVDMRGAMAIEEIRLMRRERKTNHLYKKRASEKLDLSSLSVTPDPSTIALPGGNQMLPAVLATSLVGNASASALERDTKKQLDDLVHSGNQEQLEAHKARGLTFAPESGAVLDSVSAFVVGSGGVDAVAPSLVWPDERSHSLVAQTPPVAPATAAAPATAGVQQAAPAQPVQQAAPVAGATPANAPTTATSAPPSDDSGGGGGIFYFMLILLILTAIGAGAFHYYKKMKEQRSSDRQLENARPTSDESHYWKTAKSRQSYRKAQMESGESGAESNDASGDRSSRHKSQDVDFGPSTSETEGRSQSASASYRDRRRASQNTSSRTGRSGSQTRTSDVRSRSRDDADDSASTGPDKPESKYGARRKRQNNLDTKNEEDVVV